MEPIRVRVEYSVDDYVRAFMFVQRRARRFGALLLIAIIGIVGLSFFLSALRKSNPDVSLGYILFVPLFSRSLPAWSS